MNCIKKLFLFICFFTFCVLISCKKSTKYHLRYSSDLYNPKVFSISCNALFNQPEVEINLDSFNFDNKSLIAHPIYEHCESDQKLNEFFIENQKERFPFYLGDVEGAGSIDIKLFAFYHLSGKVVGSIEGYLALRQANKTLIFRGFSFSDGEVSMESHFRNNHLLLWEETDHAYDVVDSRPKTIEVKFCVLKIAQNNDITVLKPNEAYHLLQEGYFSGLPPSSALIYP